MKNPLVEIREELNMDRINFSQLIGISVANLCGLERGYCLHIPKKVLTFFGKHNLNLIQIEQSYQKWLEEKKNDILLKIIDSRVKNHRAKNDL